MRCFSATCTVSSNHAVSLQRGFRLLMTWLRRVLLYSLIFLAQVCEIWKVLADHLTAFHHFQNTVFNSVLRPPYALWIYDKYIHGHISASQSLQWNRSSLMCCFILMLLSTEELLCSLVMIPVRSYILTLC